MNCLECAQREVHTPAIGVCHSCSAAVCVEHAEILAKTLEASAPICKTVTLPVKARLLLCRTCRAAIEQSRLLKIA
ncbi:MAG: DUF2180 family protein [Acidobacteria bacterium]|nr:DUF2180 family protein [Acidobacteriota bacterium]